MLRLIALSGFVAAGLVVGADAGGLKIHTEETIAAPASVVWEILVATEAYPEWNPYHVKIVGAAAEGQRLDLTIHKPDGKVVRIRPRVREVSPERRLVWGGGVRGLFRGEHVFELKPLGPGCTRSGRGCISLASPRSGSQSYIDHLESNRMRK